MAVARAMGNLISYQKCKCLIPHEEIECGVCKGDGTCHTCKGSGVIVAESETEVFSYILDKKGAYRDMKEPPKSCKECGGWGHTSFGTQPLYRGPLNSVSPSGSMMSSQKSKFAETSKGDGICRKCTGTGKLMVPPDWAKPKPSGDVFSGGPLMTSPQK